VIRLIGVELSKLRRDPVVIGTFAAAAGIPVFNVLVLLSRGGGYLREQGYTMLKLGDGTLTILSVMLLPLIASLAASQVFSGEFRGGTLRSVLSCPVDRWCVLVAREVVVLLWMLGLVAAGLGALLICGVALGVPPGDPAAAGPLAARAGVTGSIALAFLVAWYGLSGFTGFVTYLAVAGRNVFVPLVGGVLAAVAGVVALNSGAGAFYFGSVNTLAWKYAQEGVPGAADALLVSTTYFVALFALALLRFERMDVTD